MKSAIREIELRQNQPRLTPPPLPPPLPDGSSACSILPLSFPLPPPSAASSVKVHPAAFSALKQPNQTEATDRAPSTQPLPVNGRMETARAHPLRLPLTLPHSLAIHPLSLPSSVRSRRRRWRWSITPPPTTEMTAAAAATKSHSRRREEAKTTPELLLPLLAPGFIQGRSFWFRLRNNR